MKDLLNRLDEIGRLPYYWNGYQAAPFSKRLIDKCKEILLCLPVAPSIYPTGRKSIQFQYRTEDNGYLEFEIFEDKVYGLWVPQNSKETIFEFLDMTKAQKEDIADTVERYIAKGRVKQNDNS